MHGAAPVPPLNAPVIPTRLIQVLLAGVKSNRHALALYESNPVLRPMLLQELCAPNRIHVLASRQRAVRGGRYTCDVCNFGGPDVKATGVMMASATVAMRMFVHQPADRAVVPAGRPACMQIARHNSLMFARMSLMSNTRAAAVAGKEFRDTTGEAIAAINKLLHAASLHISREDERDARAAAMRVSRCLTGHRNLLNNAPSKPTQAANDLAGAVMRPHEFPSVPQVWVADRPSATAPVQLIPAPNPRLYFV